MSDWIFRSAIEAHHASIACCESEVFRLWVTGHGLTYIQNALFVSEFTVKPHLRNIYRKCDTHGRDELISLFESETSERVF